jgi:hypothetical protein
MPSAHVVELRNAIQADLAAASLSLPFTAETAWLPRQKPEEISDTRVLVVARDDRAARAARNRTEHDLVLDLGVQARIASTAPAAVDPLVYLTQQIFDRWRFARVAGRSEDWKEGQWLTLAFEEHLQQHVFTAVIQLTFRGYRT